MDTVLVNISRTDNIDVLLIVMDKDLHGKDTSSLHTRHVKD